MRHHPRPAARATLLLVLVAGTACDKNYENPFQSGSRTQAPSAAADIVFTSNSHLLAAGAPRDLFAVEDTGAGPARLTACSGTCDVLEGALGPDRRRVAMRHVSADTNGDRRLTAADGVALVVTDLEQGVQGGLAPAEARVSGFDWGQAGELLVFSAFGDQAIGGVDDLFRIDPNGQNLRNLTSTTGIAERRPRMHPGGTALVYERIEPGQKAQIWIFQAVNAQSRVTEGGAGTEQLANSPYIVGSDADPTFSPDGRQIVFRRLRALGAGGLGIWDIVRVTNDGTGLTVLTTGSAYRGAPDWGEQGIVFQEVDPATSRSQIVLISIDGTNRRVPLTAASTVELNFPRWLPRGQ
jgi:Tol biopolymer transport system component